MKVPSPAAAAGVSTLAVRIVSDGTVKGTQITDADTGDVLPFVDGIAFAITGNGGLARVRSLSDADGHLVQTICDAELAECDALAFRPGETMIRVANEYAEKLREGWSGPYMLHLEGNDLVVRHADLEAVSVE